MIEMRWLERAVYPENTGPGSAALPKQERVLQYRYYKTYRVYDSGTFAAHLADWAMEWSKWQDVPTVKE